MTGPFESRDEARVACLLESLRDLEPVVDVVSSVQRRVRTLPVPRPYLPRISLRAFGWSAAAAVSALGVGALGLLTTLGPASAGVASTAGGAITTTLRGLARPAAARLIEIASPLSSAAGLLDGAILAAGQCAILVCAAMVTLAVIVVSHEARGRRIAG